MAFTPLEADFVVAAVVVVLVSGSRLGGGMYN